MTGQRPVNKRKRKQFAYSALMVLIIALFVSAGFYLREHPLIAPEEDGPVEYDFSTSSAYLPYEKDAQSALTETETKPEDIELPPADPAVEQTRFYTVKKASVFTFSGLSYTQVQGVVHVLGIHGLDQQTHRGDHDNCIAGLDADDHVVELFAAEDAQKLHATLHDALGRVAIARHDAIGEGAVVHADAHRRMLFFTDVDERHEPILYLLQFLSVFLVGVFQMFELAAGIDIVAGVDAHLFAIQSGHVGGMSGKVHIGHQRLRITVGFQAGGDVLHVLRLAGALRSESYQFASGVDDALGLSHAPLGVVGIDGRH